MNNILQKITLETWILSDTHFNHKSILKFEPDRLTEMKRLGYKENEHNEFLINNWNKTVLPNDTVLFLGDFAFSGVQEIIKKLNGNIIVVLGNHDAKPQAQKWNGVEIINGIYSYHGNILNRVVHEDEMLSAFIKEFNNKKYLFCHYPLFNIDNYDRKNPKIKDRVQILEEVYNLHNCDYNIHGHTHSNKSTYENSINVCVEHLNFKPTKIKDIIKDNNE